MVKGKQVYHVTVHNFDGQIIDFTSYVADNSEDIIFPEVLKQSASTIFSRPTCEVWMYDDGNYIDLDTKKKLAQYIVDGTPHA